MKQAGGHWACSNGSATCLLDRDSTNVAESDGPDILPFVPRQESPTWRRHFLFLGVPAIVLLAGSLFCGLTNVDVQVCRWFWTQAPSDALQRAEDQSPGYFSAAWQRPWAFLDEIAPLPGLLLALVAFLTAVAALFRRGLPYWGELGQFCVLVSLLGPGLLVNTLFKDNWGRARPDEIAAFGGDHAFTHFWEPGPLGKNSSFPSGHAGIGFFIMAPAFVLYRTRPRLAIAFLLVGLAWGTTIGVSRVIQGRHYPSDVLWSAGMTYAAALFVDAGLRTIRRWRSRGKVVAGSTWQIDHRVRRRAA